MALPARHLTIMVALTVAAAAAAIAPGQPAHAVTACEVVYHKSWDNGSGFGAGLTIRNTGVPITSWTLTFTFPGDQRIGTPGWSAAWRQDGRDVTATNLPWNGALGTGASTTIGFNGTYSASNVDPANFAIDGVPCNGRPQQPAVVVSPTSILVPEGGDAPVSIRLSAPPNAVVTIIGTAGPGDPDLTLCGSGSISLTFTVANWNVPQVLRICAAEDADSVNGVRTFSFGGTQVTASEADNDPVPAKVDNPFSGATGYVNPLWRNQVTAQASATPEPLAAQMRSIAGQPTAIWLDRIGAITAGIGLAGHLDTALAQDAANGAAPVVMTLVLYDLPNRNCQNAVGSSELSLPGGLSAYQADFIDAIRAILARPQYAALRIALVVEPWSLYSQVVFEPAWQHTTLRCIETHLSGVYPAGIRYAVNQLSPLPNTYLYVDASSSGWMGWEDNLRDTVTLWDQVLSSASGGPGYDKIHGFATNVAGYVPVEEVFLPNPNLAVGGTPILQTRWIDWNPRIDEKDYVRDLHAAFAAKGCNGCGIIVDTSRNGWGGPDRPARVSTSTNPTAYVDESRLDRRRHRVGWCNQAGAGLGPRPTTETGIAGIDAFVWAKPPGESDGTGTPGIVDEDDPFKLFDPMCDPLRYNRYEDEVTTGAMPGGPHFGRWFPAQFETLVRNAYPPL